MQHPLERIVSQPWYLLDAPWAYGDYAGTMILAGSPDPHVGLVVCDTNDLLSGETDVETARAVAEHIVDLHNARLFEKMTLLRDAAALIRQLQAELQDAWYAGLDEDREQGRRNRLAEAATHKRELDSAGAFYFSDNGDDIEARIAQQPAAEDAMAGEAIKHEAKAERLWADAWVSLVDDIRFACGDNGKRMPDALVEHIRELASGYERMKDAPKEDGDEA